MIGNPSISDVEAMMIGVRNPKRQNAESTDDGLAKSAIVWVNELRLTDLSSNGGVAGTGRVEATLADLGRVSFSGSYSSAGFGALDSDICSNDFTQNSSFSISTDLDLGKFVENTGLKLPIHVDYGKTTITPKYNPFDPDIKMKDALDALNSQEERDALTSNIHDLTKYKNINFMNVRKERVQKRNKKGDDEEEKGKESNNRDPNRAMGRQRNMPKVHIYDIENFNLSFAYSETYQENPDIQYSSIKTYRGGIGYNYSGNPKTLRRLPRQNGLRSLPCRYLRMSISISCQRALPSIRKCTVTILKGSCETRAVATLSSIRPFQSNGTGLVTITSVTTSPKP